MAKSILRSGILGTAIKFGGVGLGFLFFLVVARSTSAAGYGSFSTCFALATIIGFGATGGQHVAILRFWPGIQNEQGHLSANAYLRIPFLHLLANLVVIAIIAISLVSLDIDNWRSSIWPIAILSSAFAISEVCVSSLRAKGSLIFAMCPREIIWRVMTISMLLLLPIKISGNAAVYVTATCLFISTLPQLINSIARIYKSRAEKIPSSTLSEHWQSLPGLWGVASMMPVTQHFTTVAVAVALGPIAAGAYFSADRISKLLTIPTYGANQLAAPQLAKYFRSQDLDNLQKTARSASNFSFLSALIGFFIILLFGKTLLSLFNPDFSTAYQALVILSLGQLVIASAGSSDMLLQLAKQERRYLFVVMFWGVGSIVMAWIAAVMFGITGSAIAIFIGQCAKTCHTVLICKRHIGTSTTPGFRL